MPDFKIFLMRHSEAWMQDIVERIERQEGVITNFGKTIEERWNDLIVLSTASRSLTA